MPTAPTHPLACAVPSTYFKNLYFDTLVYDVEALDFLRHKVGAEHMMLGTDFPYALGDWMGVDKIEALPVRKWRNKQFSKETRAACLSLPYDKSDARAVRVSAFRSERLDRVRKDERRFRRLGKGSGHLRRGIDP